MSKRLFLIIVGLLFLLGFWWLLRVKLPGKGQQSLTRQRSSTSAAPSPAFQATASSINRGVTTTGPTVPLVGKDKDELMHAAISVENAKPINIYGKVIDQYGQPVVGAKVKGGTLLYVTIDKSGGQEFSAVTDDQGRFSFTGLHGVRFGLDLEKKGYAYDTRKYLGWWDNYKPDANNPAIFTMWKLEGAEPMVHAKVHAYVPCDGTLTRYDILTGQKTANGDLVLTLNRNPVNIVRGQPFDWNATVELPNGGGFLAINDTYPNKAPANGFKPKLTIEMSGGVKGWDAAFERSYYFKSGKVYGRMTVSIQADFQPPPTSFDVEIYVNPSGSRNLEFDPTKVVRTEPAHQL